MLFNKSNNGSEELYNISGIFQAATDFNSIRAEIMSATEFVSDIVGSAVITQAQSNYDAATPTDDQKKYYEAVRLPIAFLAIGMHSKLSALSHGETGRKLKVDENEKIPFEWMIDRDDREMRERYYRAMNALFSFLDSLTGTSADVTAWQNSDAKKLLRDSIIKSLQDFEKVYPLEHSRYMFYQLLPIVLEIQNSHLRPIVGAAKYQQLQQGTAPDNIAIPSKRLTVLRTMVTAIERWSIDSFPLSVARRFSPSYQGNHERKEATTQEIDWYIGKIALQIKDAELELQTEISGNPYDGMRLIPDNDKYKKYFTV